MDYEQGFINVFFFFFWTREKIDFLSQLVQKKKMKKTLMNP